MQNFAPEIEIGAHQRRTAQGGEYPALPSGLTGKGAAYRGAQSRRIHAAFGEPL